MSEKKTYFFYVLPLFLLSILLVSGCGRKGMPVPPGTLRPETINDLSCSVKDEGIVISWSVPFKNHDGSPIDKIKQFRLFRQEAPFESYCNECPPKYPEPIIIEYNKKPEPGKKIVYEDTTVRTGYFYTYQVRTVKNLFNISDFSNKVVCAWHSPPGRPQGLEANVTEEGIELSWLPPDTFVDGSAIDDEELEYRIFRRFGNDKDWEQIVNSTSNNRYFDKIRRVYRKVEYQVAAIYNYHGTEIVGQRSIPLTVKARGRQHVPTPRLLKASITENGILLKWSPIRRPGIVGYFIYRKDPTNIVFQLNSTPVTNTEFIDNTLLQRGRYVYWVTAIDDSIPPNESDPSNSISVKIK